MRGDPGPTRVFVIDDTPEFLTLVAELLRNSGYDVVTSSGDDIGVETLVQARPDLILLDLRLRAVTEQLSGIEFFHLIRAHRHLRRTPVIICSADLAQLRAHGEALARDPRCWVLAKPFSLDEFEATLGAALGEPMTPSPVIMPATAELTAAAKSDL
jgi:CheY-like chemotaxis protein